MQTMLGVIGGSGVYQIDGLEGATWVKVKTPWGKPSDELLVGRLGGLPVAFLPRHGRGHVHDPATVPYRANIDALKRLGCTDIVAVSAVGSLREEFAPGDFVIVDQYIDRTTQRPPSFFGPGCVAHVSLADPTCPRLGAACAEAGRAQGRGRASRGNLPVDGGPAVFHPRRKPDVSQLGRRRDRHDRVLRGPPRPRGRALLCLDRDGDRLRLLA